ncbi:MAG: dTMP kinase [Candidatus Eremiobacterota bacterium]
MGDPLYIVFEGINASGKTTQLRRLAEALVRLNYTPIQLFEPTRGTYGLQARRLVEQEPDSTREEQARLFLLDRAEHVTFKVKPLLDLLERLRPDVGFRILQDRSIYSAPAYQGAGREEIQPILQRELSIAPPPDWVFYLDLPVETALERMRHQTARGDLERWRALMTRARDHYRVMAEWEPERITVVDAGQPEEEVAATILKWMDLRPFQPGQGGPRRAMIGEGT